MPDCWNVLECPLEHREKCGAYPSAGRQCWTVENRQCAGAHFGQDDVDCAECAFYRVMMARRQRGERPGAH